MQTKKIYEGLTPVGVWKFTIRDARTGEIKSEKVTKNIIPTIGRTAMACQLANQQTYDMGAKYIAIGTGTTGADNADTTLETEVYRKAVSSDNYSNNVAYIAGFFTAAEDNGNYKEFGIFGDGIATQASGTVDTGILYSRVLEAINKSALETLTVEWSITFT